MMNDDYLYSWGYYYDNHIQFLIDHYKDVVSWVDRPNFHQAAVEWADLSMETQQEIMDRIEDEIVIDARD